MSIKISQKKLNYTVSDSAVTPSGDGTGHDAALNFYRSWNLVRDWSSVNRKGLTQTDSDGTPHVFGVNVAAYGSRVAVVGGGDTTADESLSDDDIRNALVTVRFYGVANTWVMKQAARKAHKAREKMFSDAKVKKSDRGAYSKTIRYCLASNGESLLTPVHSTTRAAYTMGTWDNTQIIFPEDLDGAYLALSGTHGSEESTAAFNTLSIPQLYLASRGTIDSDTNRESSTTPADNSVLQKMLDNYRGSNDEVRVLARGEQDNPPYDTTVVNGDDCKLVELGRLQFNPYTAGGSACYLEVPFGMMYASFQLLDHGDSDANMSLDMSVECTAIASM